MKEALSRVLACVVQVGLAAGSAGAMPDVAGSYACVARTGEAIPLSLHVRDDQLAFEGLAFSLRGQEIREIGCHDQAEDRLVEGDRTIAVQSTCTAGEISIRVVEFSANAGPKATSLGFRLQRPGVVEVIVDNADAPDASRRSANPTVPRYRHRLAYRPSRRRPGLQRISWRVRMQRSIRPSKMAATGLLGQACPLADRK